MHHHNKACTNFSPIFPYIGWVKNLNYVSTQNHSSVCYFTKLKFAHNTKIFLLVEKLKKLSNCLGKKIKAQQNSRPPLVKVKKFYFHSWLYVHIFNIYMIFSLQKVHILKTTTVTHSCQSIYAYKYKYIETDTE